MSIVAGQILGVARTEWRVAWRGLGLRLVMALLAAPFIPYLLLPRTSFDDNGMHIFTFLAPVFGLLAAFVIVPSLRHERRFGMAELTWVRPLDSLVYVAGKGAAAVLVLAVLLAELTVLVAIAQGTAGFPVNLAIAANALLLVAPTLLFVAALYIICGAVLPHPLLGYLLAIAVAFVFMFFFSQSMVFPWNLYLSALFYNKVLGFGPDGALLLANRLLYLGLAVILAGVAVVAFARRERRALAPRRQARAALAVLVCGAALTGGGFLRFQEARANVMLSGPLMAPQAVPLAVKGYSLDLHLDPASGGEDGVAHFTIRNDGTVPVTALPLHLNDGLHIDAASIDGHPAGVRNSPQFGCVAVTPALAPGRSVAVRVAYGGHFKLLHAQYGSNQAGIQTGQMMSGVQQAAFQSYIWNGQTMLYRDGDWYPLPWIQGAMSWQPSPLGWRTLTLRLAAGLSAVASTIDVRHDGARQVFTWKLSGRLPRAILAVTPSSYLKLAVPGGRVYAPDGDARTLRARYGPYVTALRDFNRFFGRPARSVAVVAIPLSYNQSTYAYPVLEALGDNLALVQLGGVDANINAFNTPISRLAAPAPYRAALADLAIAWWMNQLPSRAVSTILTPIHPPNPLPPNLPDGYAGVTEQGGSSIVLPDYTGAAVAGQRLGSAFYEREMALRRALAALGRHDVPNGHKVGDVVYLGKGPLARQLQTLGLLGRLDDGGLAGDASPALDDLRRAIGAQRLRQALINLSTARTTPNDDVSTACALYHLTGRPITTWVNHYLVSGAAIKPPEGCR